MNRRGFLKAGAMALAAIPLMRIQLPARAVATAEVIPNLPFLKGDWKIFFSGWKPNPTSSGLTGYWLAHPIHRGHIDNTRLPFYVAIRAYSDESPEEVRKREQNGLTTLMYTIQKSEELGERYGVKGGVPISFSEDGTHVINRRLLKRQLRAQSRIEAAHA